MKHCIVILMFFSVFIESVAELRAQVINHISGTLFEDDSLVAGNTTLTINGNAQSTNPLGSFSEAFNANGGSFVLAEAGMEDPFGGGSDNQNRHEFTFNYDNGTSIEPVAFSNDIPWVVSFDINITTRFYQPRKAVTFILRGAGSGQGGGNDAQFSITTSGNPANGVNGGTNTTRGQAAVFGGPVEFNRVIGPCDNGSGVEVCDSNGNPNSDVHDSMYEYTAGETGVSAGETVNLKVQHIPSPDDGETPAKVIFTYRNGAMEYTNLDQDLRDETHPTGNYTGEFTDGYTMGLNIFGRANRDAPYGIDDYTATLSNFLILIGDADFDEDEDVDGVDFLAWQRGNGIMGTAGLADGDANGDRDVDEGDLAIWQGQYGTISSGELTTLAAVPEPSSGVLVFLAMLMFGRGRSRHFRGLGVLPV